VWGVNLGKVTDCEYEGTRLEFRLFLNPSILRGR